MLCEDSVMLSGILLLCMYIFSIYFVCHSFLKEFAVHRLSQIRSKRSAHPLTLLIAVRTKDIGTLKLFEI